MIESRYNIEYINPEATKKKAENKHYFLFTILGLIIATALAYAILSIGNSNQFVRMAKIIEPKSIVPVPARIAVIKSENKAKKEPEAKFILASLKPTDSEDSSIQKELEMLLQQNEKQQNKAELQVANNKELTNSLNMLTKQLLAERKKNEILDRQLNTQKSENNQLSELLETAMSKANSEDKKYLAAIEKTEEKEAQEQSKIIATINSKKVVSVNDATIKVDHYNSVNLSTVSQMDAIIAVMQGGKISTPNKTKAKPSAIQIASIDKTKTEQLHIQLQRQINQMLNNNTPAVNPNNVIYKQALDKESQVRQNAVRSITIRKGETLWAIAQRAYGNGSQYKKIVDANPQININLLQEGQVIRVPN